MATGVLFLGGVAGVVLHEESDGARRADRSAPPTTSLAAPSPAPDAGAPSTTLGGATTTAPPAGGSD
ncbi:MAG: chitinase, partial [Actinomycetota bacterium]|nr:chitinase [Actinomycetota bacterium]